MTDEDLSRSYQERRLSVLKRLPLKGDLLLIGVGGGGDILGTLPIYFDCQRMNVRATLGGLSWKRTLHDPKGAPRGVDEFRNALPYNSAIVAIRPESTLDAGIKHVEADVAASFPGADVISIDISGGANLVCQSLLDYMGKNNISRIIAFDVGGDALCKGDESTIRSPICDQVMLCALSQIPGTVLGVIGLGSDGELPMSAFIQRFHAIEKANGYIGTVGIQPSDASAIVSALKNPKTESSHHALKIASELSLSEFAEIDACMNSDQPEPEKLIDQVQEIELRNGTRVGELSALSGCTLFFDLKVVYLTNDFSKFLDGDMSVGKVNEILVSRGYTTEFTDSSRFIGTADMV